MGAVAPRSREAATRLRDAAATMLRDWAAPDPVQERLRRRYLGRLETGQAAGAVFKGSAVHLTASCVVLDAATTHTLLVLHGRARRWFQPGGHLEPGDPGVREAAAREAAEETGVAGLRLGARPVHLDAHLLHGDFGTCREHLDVQFAALAPAGAALAVGPESLGLRWWPVDALPDLDLAGTVAAAARSVAAGAIERHAESGGTSP